MATQTKELKEKNNEPDKNTQLIRKLLLLVMLMFGFGYALVPLYDVFCDVTGLNGKTGDKVTLTSTPVIDEKRLVNITFITSLNESMPWDFKPQENSIEVHPGKSYTINFIAKNRSEHAITGQAVPSVSPGLAAAYFQKTECFCFTQQTLKAGEEKIMPVTFIVDSHLPQDMHELILSYTFFISNQKNQDSTPSQELTINQDQKL